MADVLVVEAEDLTRRRLEVRLTDAGHRVRAAASAAQAHEVVVRTGCPDVLVTALSLPDGDAAALATGLRAEPWSADLPVIVLSGTHSDVDARILGVIQLSKTCSTEALTGAIAAVLAPVDAAVEKTVRARLAPFGRLDEYERDLIAELLTAFVQRAPATSRATERAILAEDAPTLLFCAQRLETAARNLGADALAEISADLSAHAGLRQFPIPAPLESRFRRVLAATCRVFDGLAAEFRNEAADVAPVTARPLPTPAVTRVTTRTGT